MGIEICGRQLTTRGGEIGVPKGGHFGCSKLAKIRGNPNGISARLLGDRIRHFMCDSPGVQPRLPCPWLLEIFMPLGVVTIQIGSTIAKMAKWSTLTWASTLTKVAPLRPRGVRTMVTNIHNTHVINGPLVHASGVHEVAEHGARRAENVEYCSKWPKMRTLMVRANEAHARLGPECAIGLVSSHMRPTYFLGVAQTPVVLGLAASPSEPMIRDSPESPTWRPQYAKPKGSCSPGSRYVGHRSMYPHNILES